MQKKQKQKTNKQINQTINIQNTKYTNEFQNNNKIKRLGEDSR